MKNIVPEDTIDIFYKQIKRCIDEKIDYQHYVNNLLRLNDNVLPEKIKILIESKTSIKKSVCTILFKDGKILGVSRKTDHNDFGLVGGKVDDDDPSVEYAIIRETKEETGLDIYNLKLVHRCDYGGYDTYCFFAEYRGRICTDEPHVVKWLEPIELTTGSFGEYNLDRFKELGIL